MPSLTDQPAKPGTSNLRQDGDGYILMPADGPVCARFLIEQDRPRENGSPAKFFRQFKYAIRPEQFTDARRSRNVHYVRAVALECVEHGADLLDRINRENILDDQKAVASELLLLLGIETHHRR